MQNDKNKMTRTYTHTHTHTPMLNEYMKLFGFRFTFCVKQVNITLVDTD